MSPVDARVAKIAADIQRDWELVEAHLSRAQSVDASKGEPQAALVALSLDHAYQAFETLLVRIERALGLPERIGPMWHVQLLHESGDPIEGLRPAVYAAGARSDWDGLLRFRHFLRHAYVVTLDPAKLTTNVERLERAVLATDPFVSALVTSLRSS